MTRIILSGVNGYMGQVIVKVCEAMDDVTIVAGINRTVVQKNDFPVYSIFNEFQGEADAIIDFSHTANLDMILAYAVEKKMPAVLCTTGYSVEALAKIDEAAKFVPLLRSGNMSVGINLLCELVKQASAALGASFDVEIVERHHRRKLDAPSGTAMMLADAAAEALPYEAEYVYDRHSVRKSRDRNEIGISAVRGGTIVGEHSVIFAGENEVVEISHSAQSRDVFANGSVVAAKYLAEVKECKLYNMNDVIKSLI